MVSELLWPVHTFGPRGRSNRIGALLVINQDAGKMLSLAAQGSYFHHSLRISMCPARSMRTVY